MKRKEKTANAVETGTAKRMGRSPMTQEEKEAAAKLRSEMKEKADYLKPEFILQYQGIDLDMRELAEKAKDDFHSEKKRALVTDLKLYIKPEERMAYYVINESHEGKIPF